VSAGRPARQLPEGGLPASGDAVRQAVRDTYARQAAIAGGADLGVGTPGMATAEAAPEPKPAPTSAPTSAASRPRHRPPSCCTPHSGLGCGSPTTFANLAPGEWVLDLGSGAGFDCLAAALEVGRHGRVVGIDLTPGMVRLARRHAADAGVTSAHFLQGELEALPFADATFDIVISNCVINLCPDKARVLAEAWRVLKPHGRLAVADIVAIAPLPPDVLADLARHTGCIAGATPMEKIHGLLRQAGFASAEIHIGKHSQDLIGSWAPHSPLAYVVAAANIVARKDGPRP